LISKNLRLEIPIRRPSYVYPADDPATDGARLMPDTRQSEKSSDLCHLPMSLDQVVLYDAADQGQAEVIRCPSLDECATESGTINR
jgi:hypothetical protein